MNITDIDDKIILRTHLNHLTAMVQAAAAFLAAADAAKKDQAAALETVLASATATLAIAKPGLPELIEAQHALADAAGTAGMEGVKVCDVQTAYLDLTSAYEFDFFNDLAALNVLPPDAVTRVSDYIPEIIEYVAALKPA